MMKIVLNGSFWTQPNVGSGQYLHGLLRWLPRIAAQHRYILLLPALQGAGVTPPPGVETLLVRTPFDQRSRHLAKLWFEQVGVPQTVRLLHASSSQRVQTLLHVPYFAPPLHSVVQIITTIPDLIPLILSEYRGGLHVQAYMRLVRSAARRSDHIITFSQYSRNDIVHHVGVSAQKITATLLAADERYRPDSVSKIEEMTESAQNQTTAAAAVAARYQLHAPFIYYVGGLDARKNVAVLIEALARLQQRGNVSATLAIAGRPLGQDRRLFPDLDGLIASLGVQKQVRRIEVPYEDGPLLYRACTVFAFPSRYEGFGLPPLEAMACGAPVVVSSASSLPEVVGDAALCVAPDDVEGWALALERLLTDAGLRATLSARGLEQAARFSWRRVAEETLQVYEQVAQQKRPGI